MKKFISDIVLFSLSLVLLICILTIATAVFAKINTNLSFSKEKNILVLGNSHPECAINDSEFSNVINLAQSGSGYFYDYVKAKKLIEINPQVDTLVLGYSYGDISKNMDSWFNDDYKIKHKIRNHFFLFNLKNYLSLLRGNPKSVLINTPQTIYYNMKVSRLGLKALGGYKRLTKNKILEEKAKLETDTTKISDKLSIYQTKYLLKIYQLCQEKKIKLVLLSTPIHHQLKIKKQIKLIPIYCSFAKKNMANAILVDDSNYELPDNFYADMDHLNFKGALQYSQYLKENKVIKNHNNCQNQEITKN